MPVYNKLVRDRIPEIIKTSGKVYRTRVLMEEEYISELRKKAQEELNEYISSQTNEQAIEELADLLEVVYALAAAHSSSREELEEVRKMKAEKRGGFQERIFLIDVEDE
ncbi:putative house-cleaning noncanonical NTP pyrophosphatase (MazG superfamily) [Bacillus fengqiuensis]|nr:putative house-cleaning noncanonical NTP pyrophosphatase (MazG superfamily) [Bacillus fengqiuensis]